MRESHLQAERARVARRFVPALLVVVMSAFGLAACSNVTVTSAPSSADVQTSPAASASVPAPSATSAASQTPVGASSVPTTRPIPTASSQAGALDACAVIPAAELAKIVGHEGFVTKAMPSGGWVAGQCAWNGPGSGFFLGVGTAASIKAAADPTAPNAEAMLAQFERQASAMGTAKPVAGIGDGAVLGPMGIAAYKGGTYLQITNLGLPEDQQVNIMKLAIANLK